MTVNNNAFQDIFTSKINQNKIKLISVNPSLINTKIGTEIKIINNIFVTWKKVNWNKIQ